MAVVAFCLMLFAPTTALLAAAPTPPLTAVEPPARATAPTPAPTPARDTAVVPELSSAREPKLPIEAVLQAYSLRRSFPQPPPRLNGQSRRIVWSKSRRPF